MNEKEFLKEHPSLKDRGMSDLNDCWHNLESIHETQIDKQKVKEVIDKRIKEWGYTRYEDNPLIITELKELKKELGIEWGAENVRVM